MANLIWNTGVNDNGSLLNDGQKDRHWTVIAGPGISTPKFQYLDKEPYPGSPAFVLSDQRGGTYFERGDSKWIWVNPLGEDTNAPDQYFIFQTTFQKPADTWVEIVGNWSADNYGYMRIDRTALPANSTSGTVTLPTGAVLSNYNDGHDFSISEAHPESQSLLQLEPGWHTFEVAVANAGTGSPLVNPAALNISGLKVNFSSTFPHSTKVAIDPMKLVLYGKWYDIWTQAHHPDEPLQTTLSQVLREMSGAERKAVVNRASSLATFANEVEKAVGARVP